MSHSIRAFLALEVPAAVKSSLETARAAVRGSLPAARWTRPEGWHLTLKFLGDSDKDTLERLTSDLAPRLRGLGTLTAELAGGGFFPSAARPRVAWIGGSLEGCDPLVEAVEVAAERVGYPRDRRPWKVHLTMARLKARWQRQAVDRYLGWADELDGLSFGCSEVVLYESDLQREGAVYTALERIPLE